MSINRRIDAITEQANAMLRQKKSDIVVLIAPSDNEKGWFVDICNDHRNGDEDTALRKRLEACNTFDELTEELHEYASNIPKGRPIRRRLK